MNPQAAKRLRLLASAVSLLLVLAVLLAGWLYWRVRASLPQLAGEARVPGLTAELTVERDALGVPRLRGANRTDISRGLGWLHGQERFFQMDVLRRAAAGELSALFGKRGLTRDRTVRQHGFRALAVKVLAALPPEQRAQLEAYTDGANAGLAALGDKPFEYLALRETPQPWRPEDSLLIIYAMALDLQGPIGRYERSLMTVRDELGRDALAFFAPLLTPNDAALDGSSAPLPPMPGPRVLNLRTRNDQKTGARPAPDEGTVRLAGFPGAPRDPETVIGSNAFALAGSRTATGAAMLANDMHLDHAVPNTWYRVALEYGDRKIVGVTLPGAPAVVVGSNGHVSWGFTSSYIDSSDLVVVDINSVAQTLYTAPSKELLQFGRREELIEVKGGSPLRLEYQSTIWGPIVGINDQARPLALRWTMHDVEAANFALMDMEGATDVAAGIAVAHRAGIPTQNILLADRTGDIAWTIAGKIPKRVGFDGRLPVPWTFGDRRWEGFLSSEEVPVMRGRDATHPGQLWSGNQRPVGGVGLERLGDGAYARAARAAQIRDALAQLDRATPRDLLAVQLDNRALFLERWHDLLMRTLSPETIAGNKARAALREHAANWEGRASVDAVSYWLVREFRLAVHGLVFSAIFESCREVYPEFHFSELQLEPALWAMLQEKPLHLLNPRFETWDQLLAAACDDVIKVTDRLGISISKATWGRRNTVRIRHPFSYSFPWIASWLDMPPAPLPGGDDMPRVQNPVHGASQRLVVSPGREEEGFFHMPAGQSGHPLSPHYRRGHEAWVEGAPTPLLPGPAEHTLRLMPGTGSGKR